MSARQTSGARMFGARGSTRWYRLAPDHAAAPAAPTATRHRQLLAKVQIARKELELDDRSYRQILFDETGYTSAGDPDMTEAGLAKVVERFKAMGWKPKLANGKKSAPKPASHPGAGKARAMLISLHNLGVIADSSEAALEDFAARQLGCERLQWARQSHVFRLIEALKAIADRHGWDQSLTGVKPADGIIVLKRRLVQRQFELLIDAGYADKDRGLPSAARQLGGGDISSVILATHSQLDQVAQAFGRAIWSAKHAGLL